MWLTDRLSNLVSGLGTGRDKSVATRYAPTYMTPDQALFAYRGDWLARKIVDLPAVDQVRAWRTWQASNTQITRLEDTERRLDVKGKLIRAIKSARLFGGSVIVMGIPGQDPAMPLIDVPRDGLAFLHVASRYEVSVGQLERDPMSAMFGQPTYYQLSGGSSAAKIHPTRVVRLVGAELPSFAGLNALSNDGWGDSVLQAVDDAVKNACVTQQGIAGLVQEAKVDVFKIPNLMSNVSDADYRARMIQRVELAATTKSLNNALLMDAAEEYEQKNITFGALPDIARLYLEVACAAADIPATRLLGSSAKGLNATGEGDQDNYDDRIMADQEMTLRPAIEKLDEAIIRSALGRRPAAVHYKFNPLRQMDQAQQAEIRNLDAETTAILAGTGMVPRPVLAKAVQNALIESGSYPGIEGAYAEQAAGTLVDLSGPPTAPTAKGIPVKTRKAKPKAADPGLTT